MNLLPRSKGEFSQKGYWDKFFRERQDTFEWYGEYNDLCDLFGKYCKLNDKILMSGCGNSNLSENMYDVGYCDIVNIDTSDLVVKQMTAKSKGRMSYLKMDMKQTEFDDQSFHTVIDKGTLDAIYSNDDDCTALDVQKMFTEILRVLKVVGRYICITLAQEHILNALLSFFSKWCFVRVHEIEIKNKNEAGSNLPVFAFVCTKMKCELPKPFLEMIFAGSNKRVEKCDTVETLKTNIIMLQECSWVKTKLKEEKTIEFWSSNQLSKEPRYSITIIDLLKTELEVFNGDFAVFIVQNGQEYDSMFGTTDGRKTLAEAAGFTRLAIAYLHRGHVYDNIEQIKSELSEKVMTLAPHDRDRNIQVPFLSNSSDIGSRVIVYEGEIDSRSFVIEDIKSEEQYYYRQLVFTAGKGNEEIRSKIRLMPDPKKKKKSKKRIPDGRFIIQCHEKGLLGTLTFVTPLQEGLCDPNELEVLVFGLHSVNFIVFMLTMWPRMRITCVDADVSNLYEVYRTWFGLDENEQFTFITNDVDSFLNGCCEKSYDVVLLDHLPRTQYQELCDSSSDEPVTLFKNVLKDNGILIDAHAQGTPSLGGSHVTLREEDEIISIHMNRDISLETAVEHSRSKCEQLITYVMGERKGFYDKEEWTSLTDLIDSSVIL